MLSPVPLAGVANDSNGITNIGHSFLFVLLRYRMVIWEADPSKIYVIAKMWLIATHFLKWKWRNHIPVWLCCVVLKSGFFYVSIKPGLLMEVIISRSWKRWYCTEVLEKYRIKCCSVLIHLIVFYSCTGTSTTDASRESRQNVQLCLTLVFIPLSRLKVWIEKHWSWFIT